MIVFRPASTHGKTEFHGAHMVHHFCFGPYQALDRMNWGRLRMLNHIRLDPKGARDPNFLGAMDVLLLVEFGHVVAQCDRSRTNLHTGDFGRFAMNCGADFGIANGGSAPAWLVELWLTADRWDGLPQSARGRWTGPADGGPLLAAVSAVSKVQVRMIEPDQGATQTHALTTGHGYLCLLEGEVHFGDIVLRQHDALGIQDENCLTLRANLASRYLLIDC